MSHGVPTDSRTGVPVEEQVNHKTDRTIKISINVPIVVFVSRISTKTIFTVHVGGKTVVREINHVNM